MYEICIGKFLVVWGRKSKVASKNPDIKVKYRIFR